MSHVEFFVKDESVYFYLHDGDDRFVVSLSIRPEGNRAIVGQLHGKRFYELLPAHIHEIFQHFGLRIIYAYMTPIGADYFARKTASYLDSVLDPPEFVEKYNRTMVWITCSLKKAAL